MLLWIGFAILAAVVIAALLWPLMRSAGGRLEAVEADLAVYRDQLGAIEADKDRGLLDAGEAEAARTELARRLLRAASAGEPKGESAKGEARSAAVERLPLLGKAAYSLAAIVPIAGIAVYLALGSPGLSGLPHAERLKAPSASRSVEDLIGLVETRLRQQPNDAQGWEVIAPVYARVGRFRDAAIAYGKALQFNGETPKRLNGLAESLILADNGLVGADARRVLQRLREIDPQTPEPRFWLAMAKEQDGDVAGAIADLEAMLAAGSPDAPWREMVAKRVSELKTNTSAPQSAAAPTTPEAAAPSATTAPAASGGPSPEQIAAAGDMSQTDRAQMIDRMVQGLSERLEKDGRDLEGWLRLVRAYKVMGREADARTALSRARKGLAGDEAALRSIDALGAELGLGS